MMRSMFAAISGLKAHQVMLDVTAADIANVNTVGYKSSRMTFRDSLSQLQRGGAAPGPGTGGSNAAQVGLGSQVGSIDNLMGGGAIQTTGNTFDVAISGEGWFRIGSSTAPAVPTAIEYTRAGNFTTNNAGYLTTQLRPARRTTWCWSSPRPGNRRRIESRGRGRRRMYGRRRT